MQREIKFIFSSSNVGVVMFARIISMYFFIGVLAVTQDAAVGMELRESSIDVDALDIRRSQKHLASHVLSIREIDGLQERESVLVVLSQTIVDDLKAQRNRVGLVSLEYNQSYEVSAADDFCTVLKSLLEFIPEFESVKANITLYRRRDVQRSYLHRGEIDRCQNRELSGGDVVIFNLVSF